MTGPLCGTWTSNDEILFLFLNLGSLGIQVQLGSPTFSQSQWVWIKKSTNSLFKRPSRCCRVVLTSLIIRACANAIISSWLGYYTGRHENHTGLGSRSHIRTVVARFLWRGEAAPRRSLKKRVTYGIGVHTITDSFAWRHKKPSRCSVNIT